ncbi:trypco2 family protein [Lentzea sp. NPDC034063]|uniref:trypco2 family protein n=1 Tax=unclassified Lentzea TaxID=2643253 RepID=UPI0033DB1067
MAEIGLAEAIQALRAELAESIAGSADQDIKFKLGTVDLEFQVAVSDKVEGTAGIKFWVVNAGVKASGSNSATHTVKIQLQPSKADGTEVWTGDRTSRFPD